MRFFFDYTMKDQSLYDYQGTEFQNSQSAIDFAQEMAQVLKGSLSGEWNNWSIDVRDAVGKKHFSLPVGDAAIAV
jgi:hypothetical protein